MVRGAAIKEAGAAIKAAAKTLCKTNRKASSSEARAGFLGNFCDDLARSCINFSLGQGLFARLQGDGYGNRFLIFRNALAFIDIENADLGDERTFARRSGLHNISGLHRPVDQEGEVALHGHELRKFKLRFGSCEPQFRRWYVIKKQFKPGNRPLGSDGLESARMDFAKRPDDIFWPELNCGGTARMEPGGPAGDELETAHRYTKRRKKRKSVSLGVERINPGRCDRPMSSRPCFLRHAAPDRASGNLLAVLSIVQENLPDLKQCNVGMAAISVALGCCDEPRQKAWPHIRKLGGDRIGERERSPAAAKHLGALVRNERPRHDFDKAVGSERPSGALGALLQQGQHRSSRASPG